jgi:hypothetical protein
MLKDDDLDLLLDRALASYADPGPDSGLEERVLLRLSAQISAPAPSRRWRFWVVGFAAAACFALVISLILAGPRWMGHPQQVAGSKAGQPQIAARTLPPAAKVRDSAGMEEKRGKTKFSPSERRTTPALPPKLDVFPAPQTLTAEESALLVQLHHTSPAGRRQLLEAQTRLDAPLTITQIEISPLDPLVQSGD